MQRSRVRPSTLLTWLLGLGSAVWLTSANAQPAYTPVIIDNPTPREDGFFGATVAGAGDVDHDGIPDLLADGIIFSGADRTLLLTFDRPATAAVGDVNGDGVPDFIGGAPDFDVGGNATQGRAFVSSGADGSLLLTLDAPVPEAEAQFGAAVAGADDVNGDGVPDLLVGAPRQNMFQGQAFVFSGVDGSVLLTLDSPTPKEFAAFGEAVAAVGDVNGDDVSDILVGAPSQTVAGNRVQGRAFVFSGADGNPLYSLDNPTPGGGVAFGSTLSRSGDLNGDGIPDLLVAAPMQSVGSCAPNQPADRCNFSQGQAFVFSGADGSLLHTLDDPTPQELVLFGQALTGADDLNGDGVPDVLVGAPEQKVGDNFGQGQVFAFSGADGSLLLTLDHPEPQAGSFFGSSLAAVGDLNVDGIPDFLVAVPGRDVAGTIDQGQAVLLVSTGAPMLHCPGDIDGDGVDELVVVNGTEVQVKNFVGSALNRFELAAAAMHSRLMPDTNRNGAPELVAVGGSPATAEVRDVLTGGGLGMVVFDPELAATDLELLGDLTGNGIPEIALLDGGAVRVQVRDGLAGSLVNDVRFAGYIIGRDLVAYPDLNLNKSPELAVLGENRRQDRADKIGVRDASTGRVVREIWLGREWRVLQQELINDDLDGNGSEEVAVLRVDSAGNVNVQVRDTSTRERLSFIGFPMKYPPKKLVSIRDINGNGANEVVVFGRRPGGANQKAVVKDSMTGRKLSQLWFDPNFPGQDFVSCGDINRNGIPDLALLGKRERDGALVAIVKDSRTGERLARVRF